MYSLRGGGGGGFSLQNILCIFCIFFQVKWMILPIEFEDVAIIDLLANNAETDSGIGKKLFFIQ